MSKRVYLSELEKLRMMMLAVKNTPFTIFAKVVSLTTMNMRYERVAFDSNLKVHPYILTKDIIKAAQAHFQALMDISFIESEEKDLPQFKSQILEKKHRGLWQEIWDRHSEEEFKAFVAFKKKRLKLNGLTPYIKGKDCVDFGCGNGSFAFALLELGANSVTGIDFGDKSVGYAKNIAKRWGLEKKAHFSVSNILDNSVPSSRFDFAVANGVFHHLRAAQMPLAIREVARVLKDGGWFWYYIDGKGAISMDLFDCSVDILKGVDLVMIEEVLMRMNVRRNKMVHLMDGMNATYVHSTYRETIEMLKKCGFGNPRRLIGGASTDFDHDRIAADRYGKEKFGDGDLRIFCQRLEK